MKCSTSDTMGCTSSRTKDSERLIKPQNGDAQDRQRRSTVHINMSDNIKDIMMNSGRRTIVFFGENLINLNFNGNMIIRIQIMEYIIQYHDS